MSTTTYSLQLARSENGNWSFKPSANLTAHPVHPLPLMAFPSRMSPSEARDYAYGFLPLACIPAPAPEDLDWHVIGHTRTDDGASHDAYRASWTVTVSA